LDSRKQRERRVTELTYNIHRKWEVIKAARKRRGYRKKMRN